MSWSRPTSVRLSWCRRIFLMSRDRLTRLVAIMPPPRTPTLPPGPDDWPSVERELGIGLPSDYKAFLATYGSGEINGLSFRVERDTVELHSHRDLHSFPTRRSSDLG